MEIHSPVPYSSLLVIFVKERSKNCPLSTNHSDIREPYFPVTYGRQIVGMNDCKPLNILW